MKKEGIAYLVELADQAVESAREELMRADEDVITHEVCVNARRAIYNYLKAFLLQNGVEPSEPVTMYTLLGQCQALDARFELVTLEDLHCRFTANPENYCLTIEQVEDCLGIARQIKGIVHAVTPGY